MGGIAGRGPVSGDGHLAAGVDRHAAPARDGANVLVHPASLGERVAAEGEELARYRSLIEGARRKWMGPNRAQFGGENQEAFAAVVEQTPLTHVVPRQGELSALSVPHRKTEIANKMLGGLLSPLAAGLDDEGAVGHVAKAVGPYAERLRQLLAIIDPTVGHQGNVRVDDRLGFEEVLIIDAQEAVPQPDGAQVRGLPAVRPTMRERVRHPLQIAPGHLAAVKLQDSEDCTHESCWSW